MSKSHFSPRLNPIALALALGLSSAAWADSVTKETELAEVKVLAGASQPAPSEKTGAYTIRQSNSATKLNLNLKETPQSVSVVTRAKMDDFQQNSINEVLANTTGVTVEKVETDRTYYTARGFDITNFQNDGVGSPFTFGNVYGNIDTALYDRIEVVRGATGLMSPVGNPSATINFMRKRPTEEFQASGKVNYGSWQTRRGEADISGSINPSGSVRARVVGAHEEGNSYLDRKSHSNSAFSAIVEADLSDSTLLTLGHSQQRNHSKGALWGALPMQNTDGTATNYDRSTSTAPSWTYWDNRNERSFVELSQRLNNGWQVKGTATYVKDTTDSKLFYVYGTPDASTGSGLAAYPSLYNSINEQYLGDVQASGPYQLLGREHKLSVGAQASKSNLDDISHYGQGIGNPVPGLATWDGTYTEPSFDASTNGSAYTDQIQSAYAASQLNITDNFKLIPGLRATRMKTTGEAYGQDHSRDDQDVTPYIGATYAFTPNWTGYASYTEIFTPQYETDQNGSRLKPVNGENNEAGLKGEFLNKKLNTSLAVFKTRQMNLATSGGYTPAGKAYYNGVDTYSQGAEFEVAGEVAQGWQASAGYTQLSLKDKDGSEARTFIPRQQIKVSTTWQLPFAPQAKVGASVNWQSEIKRETSYGVIRQGSYALVDLMASYDISKNVSANVNIKNVGNKKYITSLYWDQAFYGAPTNGMVSVSWKY